MAFEVHSTTKTFLICIFGFLVAVDIIGLIASFFGANGTQIGSSFGSLIFDGLMLLAIIKQWRIFLKFCRIITIIFIVLKVIVIVLAIVALIALKKEKDFDSKKGAFITNLVVLFIDTLCYSVFAFLLGKYTDQIEGR